MAEHSPQILASAEKATITTTTTTTILQRCPLHQAAIQDVWLTDIPLTTRLYGCKKDPPKSLALIPRTKGGV